MAEIRRHIGVYGDVDLNLIDGSAIWLQAVAQAFAMASCDVTVLLKAPVRTDRLTAPLQTVPAIRLVRPFEERLLPGLSNGLSPRQAVSILERLEADRPFDALVVRGFRVVKEVAASGSFDGRLWTYLTDVPHSVFAMASDVVGDLDAVARASQYLLCQTQELRSFLEGMVPSASGRAVLFPPVIPDVEGDVARSAPAGTPLRLLYTGKFALDWRTLEMTGLPAALAARGVDAELHMVGDKVHREARDERFFDAMTRALQVSEGVVWHGGMSREQAMALADTCDVGMSWRSPRLDASLELSTKILEYGAHGLPVVLNRTPAHEDLLGRDYPLFVDSEAEVLAVLTALTIDHAMYAMASERCVAATEPFTQRRAVQRVREHLERAFPRSPVPTASGRRLRVAVASHDLKFFTRILQHLEALPELEVRIDEWEALAKHDPARSAELADWADVVICEWCGPNAAWYSSHKRRGQRLVVRLHRFELYSGYPRQVDIANVDEVVCVSPHYQRLTAEITGWPPEKIVCIPNWVDVAMLDRPKYPGAQFHLGMIGIAPSRKRLDLAVDVLEELREQDDRYMLFAKTKMPWDYWWIWNEEEEQAHYRELLRRINLSPLLRGAVVFDRFGPDVAAWLQKIGWVLSTSDDESFHLAPAEGMASRAVPAILHWPGADTIYGDRWIWDTPSQIAQSILATARTGGWANAGALAFDEVATRYDVGDVCDEWVRILVASAAERRTGHDGRR